MGDTMHQPRDENGQFVSIGTLFERERGEHGKDHDRERIVAAETARRLEREVEETARRLERMVEETAIRLEKGVGTALNAVAGTALVHSDAHSKEHVAHERIHSVEKIQVDKAEKSMNERLERMNEFRAALQDAAARMVTREVFEAYQKERETRLQTVTDRVITLEKSQVSEEAVATIREDTRRQRNGFLVAVVVLGLGVVLNLVVNLLQQAPV